MKKKFKKWNAKPISEKLFDLIIFIVLLIAFFVTVYPFVYVASMSISSPEAVLNNEVLFLPKGFSLKAYQTLLVNKDVLVGFGNTIFYTVVGTVLSTAITLLAAYPLSRKEFILKGFITKLFMFTMYFSGGMVASFLLIKRLDLYDTRGAIILPGMTSVFTLIIAITYFKGFPESLIEASRLDGCNDLSIFTKVVIPSSKAIIAVVVLFYAVEKWNTYFSAILYLRSPAKQPLQVFLAKVLANNTNSMMFNDSQGMMERSSMALQMRYALIMITIIPIMMVYPFAQKHLIKGAMIGSLKE